MKRFFIPLILCALLVSACKNEQKEATADATEDVVVEEQEKAPPRTWGY